MKVWLTRQLARTYGEIDLVAGGVAEALDGDNISEIFVQKKHCVHVEKVLLFFSIDIATLVRRRCNETEQAP